MTPLWMLFIFTSFFVIGEETRQDIEVISGDNIVIHRDIQYKYDSWGNLTKKTKDLIGVK